MPAVFQEAARECGNGWLDDNGGQSLIFIRDRRCDAAVRRALFEGNALRPVFADAAVLVEGQAERILVPHFIRHGYQNLDRRYVTILELGGARAQRFRPLIEALGLTTLIIADLDSVALRDSSWRAAPPQMGSGQKTSNEVLKTWHPATDDIDTLLRLDVAGHERRVDDQPVLYVAFQKPLEVKGTNGSSRVIPRTFEEAFVVANEAILGSIGKETVTRQIAALVAEFKDQPDALAEEFLKLLKKAEKAAFALDILMHEPPTDVTPPTYIAEGLTWLDKELNATIVPVAPQSAGSAVAGASP